MSIMAITILPTGGLIYWFSKRKKVRNSFYN
jgi:hypothetical protein